MEIYGYGEHRPDERRRGLFSRSKGGCRPPSLADFPVIDGSDRHVGPVFPEHVAQHATDLAQRRLVLDTFDKQGQQVLGAARGRLQATHQLGDLAVVALGA